MKIAFVIPSSYVSLVEKAIETVNYTIKPEYLLYEDYKETPELIEGNQHRWDGIIFSGKAPYFYCEKKVAPEVLWGYFPGESNTFLKAVLSASNRGWDIEQLSTDSYNPDVIVEAFSEVDKVIDKEKMLHYIGDVTDDGHNQKTLQFHINNYKTKEISGCVTRLYSVAKALGENNIPYIFTYPTLESIREQITFMVKLYNVQHTSNNIFAVASVKVDYPEEYSQLHLNEYQYALERMKFMEQIYKYAKRISGSVAEVSPSEYWIFADRDSIEVDTKNFKQLSLLNYTQDNIPYSVCIGIGCGDTVLIAQRRAIKARIRVERAMDHNKAYCLLSDEIGNEISPIVTENIKNNMDDGKFTNIAQESGVGVHTIYEIYTFITERKSEYFEAKELADYIKSSVRNTNRILEKLQDAGYVDVLGQNMSGKKGRPRRLLSFRLDKRL